MGLQELKTGLKAFCLNSLQSASDVANLEAINVRFENLQINAYIEYNIDTLAEATEVLTKQNALMRDIFTSLQEGGFNDLETSELKTERTVNHTDLTRFTLSLIDCFTPYFTFASRIDKNDKSKACKVSFNITADVTYLFKKADYDKFLQIIK